jgi:hypothetical protein
MKWLDVCGPPGSGKSALCDPIFGPHAIPFHGIEMLPLEWREFCEVINGLLKEIRDHKHPLTGRPTLPDVQRMLWRSLRKIAAVDALQPARPDEIYVQTALAQRGLGIGWRLYDLGKVDLIRRYFEVMPVSFGVVFTSCPAEEIERRNRLRLDNPETAHENRSFMVARMLPAIEIAKEVLRGRNANVAEIRTDQPLEVARQQLLELLAEPPAHRAPPRHHRQVENVSLSAL